MSANHFAVGTAVLFGRPNGDQKRGTITKINTTTYRVLTDTRRDCRVSKALCRLADAPPNAEVRVGVVMAVPIEAEAEINLDPALQTENDDLKRKVEFLTDQLNQRTAEYDKMKDVVIRQTMTILAIRKYFDQCDPSGEIIEVWDKITASVNQ